LRIKKVKVTKEQKIMMVYEMRNKKGIFADEYSFTCSEEARPEFYAALKDMAQDVLEMCELPENYMDRITVRGVSFSYGGENDTLGATISAAMELKNSYPNLNINTPHKAAEMYCPDTPDDEMQLLSGDCFERLEILLKECEKYVKGERAQGSLFSVA
jgi:hypothetical protein